MSTSDTFARTAKGKSRFRLPDIPDRETDEVTQYNLLFKKGLSAGLAFHLGNPGATLVEADRWIAPDADFDKRRARYPDLLVALDADIALYAASNGYIVSEQGKPPDFVLEVASESTADNDVGPKRDNYAALGIPEYWRFDETGEHYGAKLAGDRLVGGEYEPIEIEELAGGVLQGYSAVLDLHLRWEPAAFPPYRQGPARGLPRGLLAFCDPASGESIASLESERTEADARIRELEARLRIAEGE